MNLNNFFTLENISLISTIIVNLILLIVILFVKNKSKNIYFFLGFIFSIFIWTISTLLFLISPEKFSLIWANLFYISGCSIPVFIVLFTETFPRQDLNYSKTKLFWFLLFPVVICSSVLVPTLIVKDVVMDGIYRTIVFGYFYYALFTYIIVYFSLALISLYKKYIKLEGIEKKQLQIIFTSVCFATVSALAVSLVMPTFGNFTLFWAGPFFSGYMLLTISYAIIRYGLFDIKLVATQFITLTTWVLIFFKILLDTNKLDRTIDSIVLILIIASGILIIKAVKKETVLREKDDQLVTNITGLNQKLEKTNIALKELDQKKSEFMSLATHQLRAPLTAMKGYSSMILDGTFGQIANAEIEDAVNKISRSTTDLTMIVEDYLNISRIEQGSMQYNFSVFNVVDLIKDVITSVKNTADRSGLKITLNFDANIKYNVNVDEGKIKQVFLNIIDNAIKYTPSGHIDIYINKLNEDKVLIKIEDTGVGIKQEVLVNLFQKFVRAPDASKINILGTGLGLYVAGQILKAHDGRAWGESDGEGKGSRFYVELKLVN